MHAMAKNSGLKMLQREKEDAQELTDVIVEQAAPLLLNTRLCRD